MSPIESDRALREQMGEPRGSWMMLISGFETEETVHYFDDGLTIDAAARYLAALGADSGLILDIDRRRRARSVPGVSARRSADLASPWIASCAGLESSPHPLPQREEAALHDFAAVRAVVLELIDEPEAVTMREALSVLRGVGLSDDEIRRAIDSWAVVDAERISTRSERVRQRNETLARSEAMEWSRLLEA